MLHPEALKSSSDILQDFFIHQSEYGFINLLGIESPGLTSSLAIAEYVVGLLRKEFWGLDLRIRGNSLRDQRVSEVGQLEAWE